MLCDSHMLLGQTQQLWGLLWGHLIHLVQSGTSNQLATTAELIEPETIAGFAFLRSISLSLRIPVLTIDDECIRETDPRQSRLTRLPPKLEAVGALVCPSDAQRIPLAL